MLVHSAMELLTVAEKEKEKEKDVLQGRARDTEDTEKCFKRRRVQVEFAQSEMVLGIDQSLCHRTGR